VRRVARNRFLDTYMRDCLNVRDDKLKGLIRRQNQQVHKPNIRLDAALYRKSPAKTSFVPRKDVSTFQRLYGFTPMKVIELDKYEADDVLKAAEAFALREIKKEVTSEVKKLFKDLVDAVNAAKNVPTVIDPVSTVGRAYYLFFKAIGSR